jgi:hypothetical protein
VTLVVLLVLGRYPYRNLGSLVGQARGGDVVEVLRGPRKVCNQPIRFRPQYTLDMQAHEDGESTNRNCPSILSWHIGRRSLPEFLAVYPFGSGADPALRYIREFGRSTDQTY